MENMEADYKKAFDTVITDISCMIGHLKSDLNDVHTVSADIVMLDLEGVRRRGVLALYNLDYDVEDM